MNESYKQEVLFKMSQGLIFYVLAYMEEDQAVLKHETNAFKAGKFLPVCNCNWLFNLSQHKTSIPTRLL